MSDERDPLLESMFREAASEPADAAFTAKVMTRVDKRSRNVILGRIAIVGLLIAFEFLLSAPLQNSVGSLSEVLSMNLLPIENEWLAVIVAPLNSVAGIIGLLLLGLHVLYRRVVR